MKMKKSLLLIAGAGLLASCGSDLTEEELNDMFEDAWDEQTTIESLEEEAENFAEGNVYTALGFFDGMVAENVEVSVKFAEIEDIYYEGGTTEEIIAKVDACVEECNTYAAALQMNSSASYPKAQEWIRLSQEWNDMVLDLCNNYCYDMAEIWWKDYDELTDAELDLWDEYDMAYDAWLDMDWEWVDFQEVYADANDISLSEDGYDVEELAQEDMDVHDGHAH